MSQWIKRFVDGTTEIGTDDLVRSRRASWSRGRLDAMAAVSLSSGDLEVWLGGTLPSAFWQSDDLEVNLLEVNPKRIVRRVQRRLISLDNIILERWVKPGQVYELYITSKQELPLVGFLPRWVLCDQYVGQWITVEIDLLSQSFKQYLTPQRI